jgi:hypothetical protein
MVQSGFSTEFNQTCSSINKLTGEFKLKVVLEATFLFYMQQEAILFSYFHKKFKNEADKTGANPFV